MSPRYQKPSDQLEARQDELDGHVRYSEAQEGEGGHRVIHCVVAVGKISADNRIRNVKGSVDITVEYFHHTPLVGVDSRGGALLGWNDGLLSGVTDHPLREDDFLEPVEVGLKQTDGSELVNVDT